MCLMKNIMLMIPLLMLTMIPLLMLTNEDSMCCMLYGDYVTVAMLYSIIIAHKICRLRLSLKINVHVLLCVSY